MLVTPLRAVGALLLIPLLCPATLAQRGGVPDIGYVYPAGGQLGTQVTVTIGGMALDDVTGVYVSGSGITAAGIEFDRPLTNREVNIIQDKVEKAQEKLQEEGKEVDYRRQTGALDEFWRCWPRRMSRRKTWPKWTSTGNAVTTRNAS